MARKLNHHLRRSRLLLTFVLSCFAGCTANRVATQTAPPGLQSPVQRSDETATLQLVSHDEISGESDPGEERGVLELTPAIAQYEMLGVLESVAISSNPTLRRLHQEAAAAKARACYADKLPDPVVGANIFAQPIETAAGSQRASMNLMQMLPSLRRLNAQAQQACFEAMGLGQLYHVECLRIIADVRAVWYRLYVVDRQIETTLANQKLLKSLIDIAGASVATGRASQSDVLLATLEYSSLEEAIVTLRQQRESAVSELNRLLGRPASTEVAVPETLSVEMPDVTYETLTQLATDHQPAVAAARIRTQATRWGVEVAELKRRPDLSLNAGWFAIDNNRPASTVVDVGNDAWSVGAQVSIPIWDGKYDAMEQEARWKHAASHASVDETIQRYHSLLLDLWEQAKAANETVELYDSTILPQARQTLDADQKAYVNGTVEFDRVIRDFRSVLRLELSRQQNLGQLATLLARIAQATGTDVQ